MIHDPRKRPTPSGYTAKFADFIRMCDEAKANKVETVVVASPYVLGDNYEEIVESLHRVADAELKLLIAPSKK